MTGALIHHGMMKDILTGIFLCIATIIVMYIMPLIGIFAWMLLPVPVLFYRLKLGRTGGGIIMAASLIVVFFLTRSLGFNMLYFGSLLMTGFFLGEFIEGHLGIEKIILFTGMAVLGGCSVLLFGYALTVDQGLGQLISDYAGKYRTFSSQVVLESAQIYKEMNLQPGALEKANAFFSLVFPGIFIISYLSMMWLNILIIKKLLARKSIVVKSIENLTQWKAPDYLIIGIILLSVLLFLPVQAVKFIAVNGLIVLIFVYFFQGIAVASYFFKKKSAPFGLRFFFYALIMIQPLFLFLVIGLGLFDTWANFRKLNAAAG